LNIQWLLVGAALLVALGAFLRVRRVARELERLTDSYWELRYDYGQLRARVTRLEPAADPGAQGGPGAPGMNDLPEQARTTGTTAFVPLSSLKR
jgi:hypothetical protein